MPESSDSLALLRRVAQGDQEALESLYQRYHARLWRYVWYQLGGDTLLAEETLQDIFLAIWTSAQQFRGEAQITTWIFQIAHHRVIDALRRQKRQASVIAIHLQEGWENTEEATQENGWEDTGLDRMLLDARFHQLAPVHREILELLFVQGFNLEETAHILNLPTGTVKSRLRAARLALRRHDSVSSEGKLHA